MGKKDFTQEYHIGNPHGMLDIIGDEIRSVLHIERWPECVYRRPNHMGRKPDRWKRYFENSRPAPNRRTYDILSLLFNAGSRWSATPVDKENHRVYKDEHKYEDHT